MSTLNNETYSNYLHFLMQAFQAEVESQNRISLACGKIIMAISLYILKYYIEVFIFQLGDRRSLAKKKKGQIEGDPVLRIGREYKLV